MSFSFRLPCALLGHRISREPVWNNGFYFAACSRCGRDIVRIPGEKWHAPLHAHVVWSVSDPAAGADVRLHRRKDRPLQAWSVLPANSRISGTAAREIRQGRQVDSARREQRRSAIPDFMDDPQAPLDPTRRDDPTDARDGPRPLPARPIRVA
jgi:hypothetical protein